MYGSIENTKASACGGWPERWGCGTSTLCDVERGKSIPNVRLAIRIAKALGTTVENLWEDEL